MRKVSAGDPISAADHNELVDAIRAATLSPGPGIRLRRTASGTTIEATRAAGGGSASAVHPFYLHRRSETVEGVTTVYFGVEPKSDLRLGISWTKQTITGLLTSVTNPSDAGWETATEGICYLAGTTDAEGVVTACSIEWGGKEPDEEITGTEILKIRYTSTPPIHQDRFHLPIARIIKTTVGAVDTWTVDQYAKTHQTLMDLNVNGYVCRYPFPFI